jgi:hypothetical protein
MEMPKSASAGLFAELGWRLSGATFFQARDFFTTSWQPGKTLLKSFGLIHGAKMMKGEKHERPEQNIDSPGCSRVDTHGN